MTNRSTSDCRKPVVASISEIGIVPIDLIAYIQEHFPNLQLGGALFYSWPIGLRFHLGGRATSSNEVDFVVGRASSIFEALFSADSSCIIVSQDWPDTDSPDRAFPHSTSLFRFASVQSVNLGPPQGSVSVPPSESDETGHLMRWTEQPATSFNYRAIFEGIANCDHGRYPAIGSRVFFINRASNTILHMYDDRGLDVVAERKSDLYPIYRSLNAWILDYDRARIDAIFLNDT